MNRADMGMFLGQMDELGNTLMKNRVLKQQQDERNQLVDQRDRFQTQDVGLRQQALQSAADDRAAYRQDTKDWREEQADDKRIALAIQNNAHGTMDDASRKEFNAWISNHPKLRGSGLSLNPPPPPREAGQMDTSQTRNLKQLQELQAQIAAATTPQEKQQAEAQLTEFRKLLPGSADDADPYDPAQKAALSAGGAEWAKANAAGDRETADRILAGINATRANARKPTTAGGGGTAPTPGAGAKHPTRALAAQYVQKFGKDAAAKLKADGYDPTAYAD